MEPTKLVPGSSFVFYTSGLKALKKSYLGTCGAITRDAAAASNENRADKLTLEFRSFWGLFEVEISTSVRVKKTTEFSKIAMYRVS